LPSVQIEFVNIDTFEVLYLFFPQSWVFREEAYLLINDLAVLFR